MNINFPIYVTEDNIPHRDGLGIRVQEHKEMPEIWDAFNRC